MEQTTLFKPDVKEPFIILTKIQEVLLKQKMREKKLIFRYYKKKYTQCLNNIDKAFCWQKKWMTDFHQKSM